jgi:ethylmalonyl-CoA/methylmalonyl-CoA decarboxylase
MAKKINKAFYGYTMSIYDVGHILDKFKKLPIITFAYINGTSNMIILLYFLLTTK